MWIFIIHLHPRRGGRKVTLYIIKMCRETLNHIASRLLAGDHVRWLFEDLLECLTCFSRANMWTAVIITLFIGGLTFYALAQYHRNIEAKDFSSVSSASSDPSNERRRSLAIAVLDKLVTASYALWKRFWKRVNRRKRFFKRYNARFAAKRHMHRIDVHHQLLRFLSVVQEQSTPIGLYIFERLDNSILYTYGMFMTVSLPKVPTVWSIRMFTGWWWLYCILVSVAYKASMTAILATPAPRWNIYILHQIELVPGYSIINLPFTE